MDKCEIRPVYSTDLDFVLKLKNSSSVMGKTVEPMIPFTEQDFKKIIETEWSPFCAYLIAEVSGSRAGLIYLTANLKDRKCRLCLMVKDSEKETYRQLLSKVLEAATAFVQSRLNLTKVTVASPGDNEDLEALLKKSRFHLESVHREGLFRDGKYIDVMYYSLMSDIRKE